jgi:hypothetical protein
MKLTGIHFLLTYQCTFECQHCFVWGSPWQTGVFTLDQIRHVLRQATDLGTVNSIYFEGGEPFLYYAILLQAVHEAAEAGFSVGIVSNAYWATSVTDALECLRPFAGKLSNLTVSSDLFHYSEAVSLQSQNAASAAQALGIPLGVISIDQPQVVETQYVSGQLPEGDSGVMYRGRAAAELAANVRHHPWEIFTTCPYEDLRDPGRLHLDPLGNLHICQGISIGNVFEQPLREIVESYNPDSHPVCGALLAGGPVELIKRYHLPHEEQYADACHACDHARHLLRDQFPAILLPDQMYVRPQ